MLSTGLSIIGLVTKKRVAVVDQLHNHKSINDPRAHSSCSLGASTRFDAIHASREISHISEISASRNHSIGERMAARMIRII